MCSYVIKSNIKWKSLPVKQINKNLNRIALEISELSQIIFSKKYEEKNRFLKDMSMTFDKKSRALKRL